MPIKSSLVPDFLGQTLNGGRLRLERVLGAGAYGVCYAAQSLDKGGPKEFAVKALLKTGLDEHQQMFQRRECELHGQASPHPGVVTLHRIFEEQNCIFLVMDLTEGDLFSMITEKYLYLGRDSLIRHVFCQIIDALEYCHSKGIYHRDLKPENILCANSGGKVMLSDFGLATNDPVSRDFGCGSSYYMSPECYGGVFHRVSAYSSRQNDIWALGIILVNLTCGRNPWRQASPNDATFRAYVHDPDFLPHILPVSYDCNEILKRIFTIEPRDRIALPDLRRAIRAVARFTMTNEELRRAPEACKAAARATWAEAEKVARRNPVTVPTINIEEHSPDLNRPIVTHNEKNPPEESNNLILSSSAGSEQISSSLTGHYQIPSISPIASIAPYYNPTIADTLGSVPHPLSPTPSAFCVAESSGPVTPEWNPDGQATAGLANLADDPLALGDTLVAQKTSVMILEPRVSVKSTAMSSIEGINRLVKFRLA